jgi:hypothetical protein
MFHIGVENNTEGRSQAWALDHPGCFAYGPDASSALQAVPQAIQAYHHWVSGRTSQPWVTSDDTHFTLVETWDCYTIDDQYELAEQGYEVNAWFRHDWKPLAAEDVRRGLLLLEWARLDLLQLVGGLPSEILERSYPGERWSINGILRHIGSAEWWYLDRLGLSFPRSDLPDDPFKRLNIVRSHLVDALPGLVASAQVVGVSGEFWSPRKLLRRAIWHELDHIAHIRKLL